ILLDAGAYQTVSPDYCLSMAKKINWTYDLSSAEVQSASVCTNTPVSGSYRGWGGPEICFVMENFMNMAARYYGVDPIELRKKNVLPPWSVTKVLNFNLGSLPFAEVMDKGSALFGWEEKRKALAEQGHRCGKDGRPDPNGRYLRGVGMAICTHTSGYFPRRPDWGTVVMKMEEDGSVSVNVNIHDHGCGSVLAFQKIAGEVLCMDPSKIAVPEGDTLYNAIDNGCYTSRSVYVLGRAVMETAQKLKEQILDYAETMLETPKEELTCENGRVFAAADPQKSLSYSDIAYYAADYAHGALFVSHTYEPASNAGPVSADFAEVEVDTYTGHCRLTDFACVHDIGKAINPEVCRSQIGSAVQNGAGMVFCEQIQIDPKTGAIRNTSMERYHVVRAAELPDVKVEFLEDASADGPFGAKSIGEAALVPVVPAILSALNDALGSEFSSVPVTPDIVLAYLEKAEEAGK
ncbi:MAG: molybdopterin-dependent oxidoreductase, partial [Firmicutes bacterium]|nr:molybdopterin-dependent oxidoreductase [Bacillota bacterium]